MADNVAQSSIEEQENNPVLEAQEDQEVSAPDDLAAIKQALAKERARADRLQKERSAIDPKEYERLKALEAKANADAENARKRALEEQGKYSELLAEKDRTLAEAQQKATEAERKALASATREELVLAFARAGGIPDQLQNFALLAQNQLSYSEDGSILFPATAIKDDGVPIANMAEFTVWLREQGGLAFAFQPLNKAEGANSAGAKTGNPTPPLPKSVPLADAYKYADEIAAGTITIQR